MRIIKNLVKGFSALAVVLTMGTATEAFASFSALPAYEFQVVTKEAPIGALQEADLVVKVSDTAGTALSGATVLVGSEEGVPFAGNKALTDGSGIARFNNEILKNRSPISVTVAKNGFGKFTLVGNTKPAVEIALQADPDERAYGFLQGKVLGFPPGYNRRTLEIGLFMPAFRPESLLNFDPQEMVSSYKVEIDVYGRRQVPGNVVMPSQDKSYGIFPVHIEKPEYIMPLPKSLTSHMASVVGGVPIGDAISAIRDKDFLSILNMTTLTHVNWTNRMTVHGDERFDITTSQPLAQKAFTSIHSGIGPKLDLVAVSVVDPEKDKGDFVAMDVKSLKSEDIKGGQGTLQLAALQQRKPDDAFYVFSGLFDRSQFLPGKTRAEITTRSLTGALTKVDYSSNSSRTNSYLSLIQSKGVNNENREYRFSSPNGGGLKADFILVNLYSEKKNELTQGVTRRTLWSALLPGDASSLSLPKLGTPVLPAPDSSKDEKFYWQVVAVQSGAAKAEGSGVDVQASIRGMEHLSTLIQKF